MNNPYQHFALLSMLTRPTEVQKILLGESEDVAASRLRTLQPTEKDPFNYGLFDDMFKKDLLTYLTQNGFESPETAYNQDLIIMFAEILKAHKTIFALLKTLKRIDEEYSGTGEHPGKLQQSSIFDVMRLMDKHVAEGAKAEKANALAKFPS